MTHDDAERRLNEVADEIAGEGMIVRASRVREGAAEIARLRAALSEIARNDRWNNQPYTGRDVWNYGACAQIAKAALGSC